MNNQQACPERPEVTPGAAEADLSAFTTAERDRLARLRRRVRSGERSEAYPVDRRHEFVRWLVEQGKLSDK